MKTAIFISSVQKELAAERRALREYIAGDSLLRRFFEVFLFEDLPALDRRADDVYLDEVDRCGIYLGLFGSEYGPENAEGMSYQVYKGTVFDLVDQAVDFVMSKIDRAVGTRAESNQAPVTYELPRDAVAEAIVNAVVHRDYANNASVQVMLFADRLEVWNPGELPAPLTFERLRRPHASIPHNPLICEPVFLARYAEKAGSGILDMIALCREAGLPEPEFRQDGGQFVQTMWRPKPAAAPQVTSQVAAQVGEQVTDKRNRFPEKWLGELAAAMGCPVEQVSEQVVEQVMAMLGTIREQPATKRQVLAAAGLSGAYLNYRRHLVPLLRAGLVEMTIPDSPTSRLQKYRLTEKGQGWLAGGQTGNAKP